MNRKNIDWRTNFNDLKDFVLGVFVLFILLSGFLLTQLLGSSNPAYNAPTSKYNCTQTMTGQLECHPPKTLP